LVVTASARVRAEGPVVLQVTATPTEYAFLWGMSENRLSRLGTGAARRAVLRLFLMITGAWTAASIDRHRLRRMNG